MRSIFLDCQLNSGKICSDLVVKPIKNSECARYLQRLAFNFIFIMICIENANRSPIIKWPVQSNWQFTQSWNKSRIMGQTSKENGEMKSSTVEKNNEWIRIHGNFIRQYLLLIFLLSSWLPNRMSLYGSRIANLWFTSLCRQYLDVNVEVTTHRCDLGTTGFKREERRTSHSNCFESHFKVFRCDRWISLSPNKIHLYINTHTRQTMYKIRGDINCWHSIVLVLIRCHSHFIHFGNSQ